MTEEDKEDLQETINQLSEQKQSVISDEARVAKKNFDDLKEQLEDHDLDEDVLETLIDIDSFNDNVKLLLSVFQHSKFDEFIYLLGRPQRLYFIHLLIGFFRGAGFLLGASFVVFLIFYILKDAELIRLLLSALLV